MWQRAAPCPLRAVVTRGAVTGAFWVQRRPLTLGTDGKKGGMGAEASLPSAPLCSQLLK